MQGQRVLATSLSVEIVGLHNVLLQVMRTGCEAPIQTFLVQFPDADSHPKIGMIGFNANCADTVLQANRIPQTLCERSRIFQVTDLPVNSLIRIQGGKQCLHIGDNTCLRCLSCAGCLVSSLSVGRCWKHSAPGTAANMASLASEASIGRGSVI